MLIGRGYEISIIDNLHKRGKLSGCFLFFGPNGIGKFSVAKIIAKNLEAGASIINFETTDEESKGILTECLTISPDEKGTIGIDDIRRMKSFLNLHPVNSPVRCVIVNDADKLTDSAANAALKIVEEPPEDALIIMIAVNPDNLIAPLLSRLKKIYFSPISKNLIKEWIQKNNAVDELTAEKIASQSFGSPEFADFLLAGLKKKKKPKIDLKFDSDQDFNRFVKENLSSLYNEERKDYARLAEFCRRIAAMGQFNTNKKLQLQTIKWTH